MLKVQYISDLHLEFAENRAFIEANPIEAKGDILLMAGDIVPLKDIDKLEAFFDSLSQQFQAVYWLPGNHEYYGSDIKKCTGEFSENIRENVCLLNNKVIEIEGFKLVFSTLWSELPEQKFQDFKDQWPDFKGIENDNNHFSPIDYNKLYKENTDFLENTLQEEESNNNTIVVTHHPPTYQAIPKKYAISPLKEAFASEQANLIKRTNPKYWIYGHCHYNKSVFDVGNTTLLTNQLGNVQKKEQEGFSGVKVVELI